MPKYEKVTKKLRKVNVTAVEGWAAGFFFSLGALGMYAYGVRDVFWIPAAGAASSGFWVVVWKIAQAGLGGIKREKTEVWQRVDPE